MRETQATYAGEAARQRLSALPSENKQHCCKKKSCTKESLVRAEWSLLEMDAGKE